MRISSLGFVLGLTLAGASAGCIFSFDNFVDRQPFGSISGQVQLVQPAAGQTLANAAITVLWTGGLTVKPDQAGSFLFLGLPDGTYTFSVVVPPVAANDLPLLKSLPLVRLPFIAQQVDALKLGILSVPAGIRITGKVVGAMSPNAVVAVFSPDTDAGPGVFEGYQVPVDSDGGYSLVAPAGSHSVVASDLFGSQSASAVGDPLATIAQDFTLGTIGNGGAGVTGNLVFGGGVSDPPGTVPMELLTLAQFEITDDAGMVYAQGNLPVADGGTAFRVPLPAGGIFDVTLSLPATGIATADGGPIFDAITLTDVPSVVGRDTALGQVTWLPRQVFAENRDAGPDAGDGGLDGGTDGGFDGGTDGGPGLDSGYILPDAGDWSLLGSFSLPAGVTAVQDVVPMPMLVLPDAGIAHRMAWASTTASGSTIQLIDDSSGTFANPRSIPDAGLPDLGSLAAGTFPDGGDILAWTETGTLHVAYAPGVGAPSQLVVNADALTVSSTYHAVSVIPGTFQNAPGTFILFAADQTKLPGEVGILFTVDGFSFIPTLSVGATGNTVTAISATPCSLMELGGANSPGLCLMTSGLQSDQPAVTLTAIATTNGVSAVAVSGQIVSGVTIGSPPTVVSLTALAPGGTGFTELFGTWGDPNATPWFQSSSLTSPVLASSIATLLPVDVVLPVGTAQALAVGGFQFAGGVPGYAGIYLPPTGTQNTYLPELASSYQSGQGYLRGYFDPLLGPLVAGLGTSGPPTLQLYTRYSF